MIWDSVNTKDMERKSIAQQRKTIVRDERTKILGGFFSHPVIVQRGYGFRGDL